MDLDLGALMRTTPVEELKAIIEANRELVNKPDENDTTPLIAAIASRRREVIKLLLDNGADPNYTSAQATLPLIFAIDVAIEEFRYDETIPDIRTDVIEMLINCGADANRVDVEENETPSEYSKGRFFEIESLFNRISGVEADKK